jgi:deazaflavin-dependent oxidoreductase (nitroreductase family)
VTKPPPPASSLYWKLINLAARVNVAVYRMSGGRLGGRVGRAPILLLHHVGRRSGKVRVTPLLYLADADRLVIVASKGGADRHPSWFHNLMANPATTVEVGRERRRVTARRANGEEQQRLWRQLVEMYPSYATYQTHTSRLIPVVVLQPA